MTREFRVLMQLVGSASQGKKLSTLSQDIDWLKIEQLAEEQQVQALVGYALRLNPDLVCPQDLRKRMIKSMRQAAVWNYMRRSAVLQLLQDMNEAGIPTLLLKGYAIADCYAVPDCRLSGDADFLIDPKEEKRACIFLKSQGFSVAPRWKKGHHVVCHHPQIGCVELHVKLYDELIKDVWFHKMDTKEYLREPNVIIHTPDGDINTLGYTDHMIFLMLHLIKHFIKSGMSLRMMIDATLFFIEHREMIDNNRFWRTMERLNYSTISQSIFWATARDCDLDISSIPGLIKECPAQVDIILDDLENGGCFGYIDHKSRGESEHEYNRQIILKDKSTLYYYLFMFLWKKEGYIKALFPTRDSLAEKYPSVRKYPVLIPFVWLHRLAFRGSVAVRKGALTSNIVIDEHKLDGISKKRVEMFKQLNMLD